MIFSLWEKREWEKRDFWKFQHQCILVREFEIPEMYPEFAPGPPDDCLFPEYWDMHVEVFFIDTEKETCKKINSKIMKEFYKYIQGMKDRKRYWRIMKYLEFLEKEK